MKKGNKFHYLRCGNSLLNHGNIREPKYEIEPKYEE